MYVQTPSGEAFVSQLLSVHSPLYYLPETGIARLVVMEIISPQRPYYILMLIDCFLFAHLLSLYSVDTHDLEPSYVESVI